MPDQVSRSESVRYSLKAACSHCGCYGIVDDMTLVCFRCGERHDLSNAERQIRDSDLALWASVGAEAQTWA